MRTTLDSSRPWAVSLHRLSYADLLLIFGGGLVLVVLVAGGEALRLLQPLRLLLGLGYVLIVPGYCLTAALFPRSSELDGVARAALSFGLSAALIPLLALVLDRLPWGIRTWPIMVAIYSEIVLFAAIVLGRRAMIAPELVWTPNLVRHVSDRWRALRPAHRPERLLYAAALATLLFAAAALILAGRRPAATEFYVLGRGGLAEDYPRDTAVGEPVAVTVGINSREQATHGFRVEVWTEDPWSPDRRTLVAKHGPLELRRGQLQQTALTWTMPSPGEDQQVELLLFMDDRPEPYRRLWLWLDVTDPAGDALHELAP